MTGPGSIPDDVKWRIASEFSAQLPALYDRTFRTALGDQYDEMEQEVWMEVSKIAFTIAKNLNLPVRTAQELAETMRTIMTILFGPEFKTEALEVSKDGSVIIIKRCPILAQGYGSGTDGNRTFRKCMAFVLTAIPQLNKDFSGRFVRTMCTGDRQCEIKIQKSGIAQSTTAPKKR
ncbi:MAG: hypothetical protein GYA23_07600 [Methanomicrobiales archaeon]|nr:hypothetical protein [Methanomicrobiales archaeon]